ncbi:hypothetical protein [Streptomyces graminilatus]|uniref:hypothetical protein n=1 Tax=Streptomyces graminilatus TaxID=1464070 RepID=UPI0006E2037C|nr:hypothetical protein [Streptomyces graminilatus]
MDIDEHLQQVAQARFGSAWDGCVSWAGELTTWYLAQHPATWKLAVQKSTEASKTVLPYVELVTACALHSTAVTERMDAPDGSQLLAVPLTSAVGLLDHDRILDTLGSASPPDDRLTEALHNLRAALEDKQRSRGNAAFIVQQARDSLAAHAELGSTVGDRLRAVLETRHAFSAALGQEPASREVEADTAVYDRAQTVEQHATAVHMLQAILRADEIAGTKDPGRNRNFLLQMAALHDRYALAMGDIASDVVLIEARDFANILVEWDRRHGGSAGAVPAADPRWTDRPRNYVRQEYGAYLDWLDSKVS